MKYQNRWTALAIVMSGALIAACSPSNTPLLGLEDIPDGFDGPTLIAVTDDQGQSYGPFELTDATQPYSFAVDFVTSLMRFDVVDSNGGNTGFVELAAYGTQTSGE